MRSDDIATVRFRTTVFEPGYEQQEVDTFLDRAAEALRQYEGGLASADIPLDAQSIEHVRFTSTRFREGYHAHDVDGFLDRLGEAFARHERDGGGG